MSSTQVSTGLGFRTIAGGLEATQGDFSSIPIVDLQQPEEKIVESIRDACARVGFFYLTGHGVPNKVIDAGFAEAKRFFDLPLEEKEKIDIHKSENMKGYTKLKGENVDPANRGDMHEGFDIGGEDTLFAGATGSANQWPDNLPGFKENVVQYWDAVRALGIRLFPYFAQALDLPKDFFESATKNPGIIMRLLYYPAQHGEVDEKSLGIGAHTDYEAFTILAQDDVQALQVLNKDGGWVHATPMPYHFVVNIADTFQRWTNDVFVSTVHRAINRSGKERYSIPMFIGVDPDTLIKCLPSCVSESRPARYEPVKAGEYVENRLRETYAHSAPVEASA
ncbi:Clavaminate synthase-like protein [Cystobasidium minutum MCA 4210]|uniref:Clavaminate synthase-like protein n=1 Tax=Cystobasidium minutum MCA 4210 TaxID=1397322 RepID=UPI0034CD371D|eukprot:jgi/Rhomi1/152729/estExt_Genewise1.C_4_t20205